MPSPLSRGNPSKIFISYRRSESAAYAGRLSDQLRAHFGTRVIFIDVESIEPGRDFVKAIDEAVGSCKILLVVIGQQWLTCANQQGRRLDDPEDFVRLEIAAALKRDIRVIPVLVQGAAIPPVEDLPDDIAPLARRQAWEVSDIRWNQDVGKLIKKIAGDIPPKYSTFIRASSKRLLIQLAAAILFVSAVIYTLWTIPSTRRLGPPQSCKKLPEGETQYYEAEDANLSGGARRDREYLGFSGYSFVSGYGVDAAVGANGASTTFEVDAPSDGQYRVDLCYANGNDSPRTLTIYVNGERLKRTVLPNAARWNIWLTQGETLPLRAGNNTISYRKLEYDDGEVNLDFIGIVREQIISTSPHPIIRLDEAITHYREGVAAHPEEVMRLTNLSEALRRRGIDRFNTALKSTDNDAKTQGLDAAKKDWTEAADLASKAVTMVKAANPVGANVNAAAFEQNKRAAIATRALALRLVATKVDHAQAQAAWDASQEHVALEADPVKKAKLKAEALQMLFDAGSTDLAVRQARALLAEDPENVDANRIIGLALFASGDKAKFQEAANYLQRYVDKAPDTDPLKQSAEESLDFLKTAENVRPERVPARPARRP